MISNISALLCYADSEQRANNTRFHGSILVTIFMYSSVNKVAFVVIGYENAIVASASQFITVTMVISIR